MPNLDGARDILELLLPTIFKPIVYKASHAFVSDAGKRLAARRACFLKSGRHIHAIAMDIAAVDCDVA